MDVSLTALTAAVFQILDERKDTVDKYNIFIRDELLTVCFLNKVGQEASLVFKLTHVNQIRDIKTFKYDLEGLVSILC
jgi:hypothetical protein